MAPDRAPDGARGVAFSPMADLPTRDALFAAARRYLKLAAAADPTGVRLNPAVADVAGSDLNLAIGMMATMGEEIVAAFARCILDLMLETATKDALDRLAYDRLGATRIPDNAATVTLALTRPTAGAGAGTVPAGTRVSTAGGNQYALNTDAAFGAIDLAASPVDATALVVGPTENAIARTVTRFVDGPFDGTIAVTNPEAAAGGTARESDAAFRGRLRSFFLTVRRGTLVAIAYGARQVPGIAVASAFEIVNPGTALPAGAVQEIVGDAAGNASNTLLGQVRTELLTWRCAGIPVFVASGIVRFVPVTLKLTWDDGVDTVAGKEEARGVTTAVAQFLSPGQRLDRSAIAAGLRAVPGLRVQDDTIVAPTGDVVPTDNTEILRVDGAAMSFV